MSTAAVTVNPVVVKPHVNEFINILQHVKHFFEVGVEEVAKYTPQAAALADMIFPEYAGLINLDAALVEGVATTIQNNVILAEQKYSDAAPGDTTNAAKLADVIAGTESVVLPALAKVNINVDNNRYVNIINAVVGILKTRGVPGSTAPQPAAKAA